eukprot:Skav218168  [mRNA]  locus=scaffold5213:131379:138001:- [translate_table: standard]
MDSMPGPISENLRRIEGKLDGLHSAKICQEEVLLKLESAISSQSAILQEVQTQLRIQGKLPQEARVTSACSGNIGCSSVTPPSPLPASILKKKTKTEEVDLIPLPEEPHPSLHQTFAVVPGEVERRETPQRNSLTRETPQRNSLTRETPERNSLVEERRPSLMSQVSSMRSLVKRGHRDIQVDFIEAASVDDLSLKTTRKLLRGFSACSATFSLDERLHKSPMTERSASKHAVLERTHNLSLDELHKNHNAVVSSRSLRTFQPLDTRGSMPLTAELLLATSGILEACSPTLSRLWVLCMLAAWQIKTLEAALTICSEMAMVCMLLFRYARQAGFIKEWRRKSGRRLIEAISCLILMCGSRCVVYMQLQVSTHDLVLTSAFCLGSVGLAAIAYLQLHIFSGLELAIDSFSVNFFRDMNFQNALAEWNVLQAMMRHVSTKLSGSLLVLGLSSGISILYLIEVTFVRSDLQGGFAFLLSNLWSLPPIIFFLYTMMRAAAVTEKASRVSPLINSWTFVGEDTEDTEDTEKDFDEKGHEWMDLERQYMVQYINQSGTFGKRSSGDPQRGRQRWCGVVAAWCSGSSQGVWGHEETHRNAPVVLTVKLDESDLRNLTQF